MDQNTISILQQLWWLGLIPTAIAVIIHFWYRHYQKTHVESQCVIAGGCTIGTIILIYYIVCIIAACFSILGFFVRLFK